MRKSRKGKKMATRYLGKAADDDPRYDNPNEWRVSVPARAAQEPKSVPLTPAEASTHLTPEQRVLAAHNTLELFEALVKGGEAAYHAKWVELGLNKPQPNRSENNPDEV